MNTNKARPRNKWTLKPPLKVQNRMGVLRPDGHSSIRVSHRAAQRRGTGWKSPRYLLRCGCCDQSLEIYYGVDSLEINGVHGSIENWREILLPLLRMKRHGGAIVARPPGRETSTSSRKRPASSLARLLKQDAIAIATEWFPLEEEAARRAESSREAKRTSRKRS